jgi:hypothetical protein
VSPLGQGVLITGLAGLAYLGLRSMPDTHCSFLHAAHEPVLVEGVEFCGEDEEANFYDPATLRFPFSLRVETSPGLPGGTLRVLDESKRPVPPHLFAVSHTRQLHLHLRQGPLYAHLHPEPSPDGSWGFRLPKEWEGRFLGGEVEAYVDFQHARSRRTILASARPEWPRVLGRAEAAVSPVQARLVGPAGALVAGESALLAVRLARPDGSPAELRPVMGALGHAVLFSEDGRPGYAHIHPSFTGRERGESPELAFRLRLPPAGRYVLFVHVDDAGREAYAPVRLEVSARP